MLRTAFCALFLCLVLIGSLPLYAAESIEGKVVSVADGDTITVLENDTPIKVRLYGVDAPEKAQDFGTVSRKFTSDLCFGQEVSVDVTDTDRYGRKVGRVTLPDGRVLNRELVKAGLAHWYAEYAPDDATLKELQAEAKAAKRGLWSRSDVVAPWAFRKVKRKPDPTPRAEAAPKPSVAEERPAPPKDLVGGVYITESGKKFHRASCRTLKKSKIPISQEDAVKRGYGRCSICKP